jgi:tetratricopeptide (TPR) repeat protein
MYLDRGLFFEALFNLQAGVKVFPKSGELCNNLALLYDRSNIADSAFIYHQLANQLMDNQQETAQTNLTAFWIRNNALLNADSLLRETAEEAYIPLQTNRLVLSNLNNVQPTNFMSASMPEDSLLNNSQFAYLFNYTANTKTAYDTTLAGFYTRFSKKEANTGFNENLRFAEACYEYYKNDRAQGFESVVGLSVNSPLRSTYFSKIAGLWFLQQHAPKRAVEFFTQAIQGGDTSITMQTYEAFALSEAGAWMDALTAWRELLLSTDVNTRTLAKTMEIISGAILAGQPAFAAKSLDDSGKALLIYFSKNILLPDVPVTITNTQYRVQTLAQLAERCIEIDSLARADEILTLAKNISSLDEALQYRLNAVSLELMLAKGQYQPLLTTINSLPVNEEKNDKKLYWQAVSYEQTKNYEQAALFYKQALKRLPLNTDVVQKAGQFYETVQKNPELAYTTLLEATRLNPFNIVLQKEYILQCLNMQLLAYAENAMNNLREITSSTDYQSFLPVYESRRTSVEKQIYDWK